MRQLLVDLAPQPLRQGGALPSGRYRDPEIATADDRPKIEIAVRRVVDRVTENIAFDCAAIDSGVDRWIVGRSDNEEYLVEIGVREFPPGDFKAPFPGQRGNLWPDSRCDYTQASLSRKQRRDLLQRNVARANKEARAAGKFYEDRQQAHDLVSVECHGRDIAVDCVERFAGQPRANLLRFMTGKVRAQVLAR